MNWAIYYAQCADDAVISQPMAALMVNTSTQDKIDAYCAYLSMHTIFTLRIQIVEKPKRIWVNLV